MSLSNQKIIEIDRAVFELRRGRVVQIDDAFFMHPEFVHDGNWAEISAQNPQLVITTKRAEGLFKSEFSVPQKIAVTKKNQHLISLMLSGHANLKEVGAPTEICDKNADAALVLARIAELLPTMLLISGNEELAKLAIKVSADDVLNYKNSVNENLELVAETPLKLKNARKAYIKAFRPQNGGSEHLAIIIGEVSEQSEPLIRVHSSCYTGDLLGSLACDCGDQLSACIRLMDEAGGGVILYLIQEGRGIGLINKLRAYDLQTGNMDTVEANEFLGFDDEEREFEPAARILRELGISKARLVSNNPRKAKDLEELGIEISGLVPLLVTHEHNHDYVQTKGAKSGHII